MISICTIFYPWYRAYDRTEEIFDVLLPSILEMDSGDQIELSIMDGGTSDVWKKNRQHDSDAFKQRISRTIGNIPLVYTLDPGCITFHDGMERFWKGYAIEMAARQSTGDKLFLIGIDSTVPPGLSELFSMFVDDESAMVLYPFNIFRGKPYSTHKDNGFWRNARGITGFTRDTYFGIGGTQYFKFKKSKQDSNRYDRAEKELQLSHLRIKGCYHIDHPGTNEHTSEFRYKGGKK